MRIRQRSQARAGRGAPERRSKQARPGSRHGGPGLRSRRFYRGPQGEGRRAPTYHGPRRRAKRAAPGRPSTPDAGRRGFCLCFGLSLETQFLKRGELPQHLFRRTTRPAGREKSRGANRSRPQESGEPEKANGRRRRPRRERDAPTASRAPKGAGWFGGEARSLEALGLKDAYFHRPGRGPMPGPGSGRLGSRTCARGPTLSGRLGRKCLTFAAVRPIRVAEGQRCLTNLSPRDLAGLPKLGQASGIPLGSLGCKS